MKELKYFSYIFQLLH